jgi:hypothetical protein
MKQSPSSAHWKSPFSFVTSLSRTNSEPQFKSVETVVKPIDEQQCHAEIISALQEENALLRGVLDVLRVDLQIKDDQIDKVGPNVDLFLIRN